jgi:hypothetical protein
MGLSRNRPRRLDAEDFLEHKLGPCRATRLRRFHPAQDIRPRSASSRHKSRRSIRRRKSRRCCSRVSWKSGVGSLLRQQQRSVDGLRSSSRQETRAGASPPRNSPPRPACIRATSPRAFRQRFGVTVCQYARNLGLEWAASQLASESPLAEIAVKAGFADQSHFTREFRRHFGVTPGRYRAM